MTVTLDVSSGGLVFEWRRHDSDEKLARGRLTPTARPTLGFDDLEWKFEADGETEVDFCSEHSSSVRALLNRVRKRFPVPEEAIRIQLLPDVDMGAAKAGLASNFAPPSQWPCWRWLARQIQQFARFSRTIITIAGDKFPERRGMAAARLLACEWLGLDPGLLAAPGRRTIVAGALRLRVTQDFIHGFIELEWRDSLDQQTVAVGRVGCAGRNILSWDLEVEGRREHASSNHGRNSIHSALKGWLERFPIPEENVTAFRLQPQVRSPKPLLVEDPPFLPNESPWDWLEEQTQTMAEDLSSQFPPPSSSPDGFDSFAFDWEREARRLRRKEQKREEEQAKRQETMARLAEERRRKEQAAAERRSAAKKEDRRKVERQNQNPAPRLPLPPVPVRFNLPSLEFQETTFPLEDLRHYSLREQAALWWISNQSDDLLCLPYCRIERLEYQVRTALRALGLLRGRALLSDEVGLGKTIEAGLVLKELLTRGMVKRFLVLTVPSLVDQWEEELSEKFGLATATTNQVVARSDPEKFWRDNPGIIASLHTVKQPTQLAVARQVQWDILIVDEAHYLRNRESLAWRAVNVLPRHFLLLLTATPVQNSLEELYNLVTLLQPGQLPSPKEFRARFIDPKRPRQPREPEELRRLLGQVMIRNTRANAGLRLPSRRAETVLFEPEPVERAFWQQWEGEFRARLAELSPSQANLWGRLLLQAAGSSPAAWRDALEKFPERAAARAWREQAPLEASWQRKCELLRPLTRVEGGAVIFTQFLQTQAAVAEYLRRAGVETFVINGATPPPARQPITEEFQRRGGALLLTHSGTEGRNLQFSHCLANFDLPWNPMEIEQRIGRLHRLGQRHPVHIYNFVQAGTLQEHLLQILQEKLNLFELVVGETGLVLGERFGSDEFAEEVLRRWRESEGRVGEALADLGKELAAARDAYGEVKALDETLFAKDYESL
ncbi:MAG TPA: SNF2-related protein [Candidatus Binatia bacterium]|nr:SNF2-related protein [Candidatus Binatia bacterium]